MKLIPSWLAINVLICDLREESTIPCRLDVNNQAEDGLFEDEEYKEIEEFPLPNASEAMMHIYEL